MYYIITPKNERCINLNHTYKTGSNYINTNSDILLSFVLYIYKSSIRGNIAYSRSVSHWIRPIIIPINAYYKRNRYTFITNNIILGDKYSLFNIDTIKKFHYYICCEYIDHVIHLGHIHILEWLNNNKEKIHGYFEFTSGSMDEASATGDIKMLDYLKNLNKSGIYSRYSLKYASLHGHINVLNWWKNSGLKLKYDEEAFDTSEQTGNFNVLKWWITSGLPIKSRYYKDYITNFTQLVQKYQNT